MTNYELTELVRYMAQALVFIEEERFMKKETTPHVGEFKYIVDRIDNAEKEDKMKRVDATMADWLTSDYGAMMKNMPHILLGHPTSDATLMKILQLVAADIMSRQEARELLGLTKAEGLRDL